MLLRTACGSLLENALKVFVPVSTVPAVVRGRLWGLVALGRVMNPVQRPLL